MSETPDPLAGAFTAEWLMEQRFPPVSYAVEGIVPEGLTILVAPPKLGKSWLVLDVALNVSVGGLALGCIDVALRPVLYLALEDGQRRLQSRIEKLGSGSGSPYLSFKVTIEGNPVDTIAAFLDQHRDHQPLVIIDTLGKIKGVYNGNDSYGHDYAQAAALKALVDRVPGSSMLVVHHTNKGEKSDFVDSVSGTHGIAGAADTILTLTRSRNDGAGTLNVTSRDAAEGSYAVTFDEGKWTLDGSSLSEASQQAQNREATAGLGGDMATIIEAVQAHPEGVKRAEVIRQTGIAPSTVDTYLHRAVEAERVERSGRGLYTPVRSVRVSDSEVIPSSESYKLTQLTGVQEVTDTTTGTSRTGDEKPVPVVPEQVPESQPTNGTDPDLQTVLELMPIDTPTLTKRTGWGVQKSALLIQKARKMEATR